MRFNFSVNGLRGLLALTVLLYHSYHAMTSQGYLSRFSESSIWYGVEGLGPIAVYLFFAISGYLIIQSLINSPNLNRFFVGRIIRIYPVFLVIHLALFTAGPIINYEWMSNLNPVQFMFHFFSNLLMLPGIFDLPRAQIVAWSLSYEFAFYILSSLFFISYKHKFYYVIPALLSLMLVIIHPTMLYFLIGVAIYYFKENIERVLSKESKIFYFNSLIFLGFIFFSYDGTSLFLPLIFNFLFFLTIVRGKGLVADILKTGVFKYLGNISYSLYLWHTVIMFPLKKVFNFITPYIQNGYVLLIIFTIASLSISIIVSHYSYEVLEKRLAKFLKRKMRKPKIETKERDVKATV
jgi:peptidoglycan/LPS O-acetylase OafA/YrhL